MFWFLCLLDGCDWYNDIPTPICAMGYTMRSDGNIGSILRYCLVLLFVCSNFFCIEDSDQPMEICLIPEIIEDI